MLTKWILAVFLSVFFVSPVSIQAKNYRLDPSRSSVEFKLNYLDILELSQRFYQVKGKVKWNKKENKLEKLRAHVYVRGLTSGDEKRDVRLLELSQIEVKKKVIVVFRSFGKPEFLDGVYLVSGILDFNGRPSPVTIPFAVGSNKTDESGDEVVILNGNLELLRKEWSLGAELPGVLGDRVHLSFQLIATK